VANKQNEVDPQAGEIAFRWEAETLSNGQRAFHVWFVSSEPGGDVGATAPNLMQAVMIAAAILAATDLKRQALVLEVEANRQLFHPNKATKAA
jgi:hypothetical protein